MNDVLTKRTIEAIASDIEACARENASCTVTTPVNGYLDLNPEWEAIRLATLCGIIDSGLTDPRACQEYGAERPLSSREVRRVIRKVGGLPRQERKSLLRLYRS